MWNYASLYPNEGNNEISKREETIVEAPIQQLIDQSSNSYISASHRSLGTWFILMIVILFLIGVVHF
jgi:hypothetical protein